MEKKKKVRFQATLLEIIIFVVWFALWIGGAIFSFKPQGLWPVIGIGLAAFVVAAIIGFFILWGVGSLIDALKNEGGVEEKRAKGKY